MAVLTALSLPWNILLEEATVDLRFKLRGARSLPEDFLFVFIGAEDAAALGGWPITRDYYGYLAHELGRRRARVVAFDLLFDSPNREYPEHDHIVAGLFETAGNVCLPYAFADLAYRDKPSAVHSLPRSVYQGRGPSLPMHNFRASARAVGFSNLEEGPVVRRVPLAALQGDSLVLSFGAQIAATYLGGDRPPEPDDRGLLIRGTEEIARHIPLDDRGRLRLNHFGGLDDVASIGLVDLLQALETQTDSLDLEGKLVLVAATAPGLPVLKTTPLADALPGGLIHLTVAENIIRGNYLREASPALAVGLVLLLGLGGALLGWTERRVMMAAAAGLLGFYWLIAGMAFSLANYLLPLFYPTLALVAGLISARALQLRAGRRLDESVRRLLQEEIALREAELADVQGQLADAHSARATLSEQARRMKFEKEQAAAALEKHVRDLRSCAFPEEVAVHTRFSDIIHAPSGKMAGVIDLVARVGGEEIPVLLLGETGTGKELIARAIHKASPRAGAPFVAVNCGALPETLLESELFGHEKGSFTGATSQRKGRFELAHGGTIFLDEITETSSAFQARLLRVLQDGSFERLGGERTLHSDARVIAATNRELPAEMDAGRFRADLFYRLNGFPITLPPLRDRPEEIPLLAAHLLRRHGHEVPAGISEQALEIMQRYAWPGNVRELENVIRRAAIMAQGEGRNLIQTADLPGEMTEASLADVPGYQPLEDQILEMLRALKFTRSAISETARALGNRDRGTITEHFRGLCFRHLVEAGFDRDQAAMTLADMDDPEVVGRVRRKLDDYLANLSTGGSTAPFHGLPKKFHPQLREVLDHLRRNQA